ncbi:MAG: prepilin-type N-terminal cleavage/methylation domain-containing protein, partial [Planctomycetota bacterium]
MSPARGTRGFSLTELLVVITVILTLVSILAVGTKHLLVKSSQLQCQQRMEHIFHGCLMYANQNRGVFPASWDFSRGRAWYETLVQERLLDSDLAIGCPCVDTAVTAGEVGQSPGIPPQVSDTIIKALEWLKAHQAVSGTDNQLGHWGHNGSHNRVEGLPLWPQWP